MSNRSAGDGSSNRKRLAIIGCGSSGLITLKYALEFLPNWEVICYEKTDSIIGCWGNPYPGFVSTSTKYTTQFACFPICGAEVNEDGGESREEFFRNDEYGKYLTDFATRFELQDHIVLNTRVENLKGNACSGWTLKLTGVRESEERFDAVVICTGLAAKPKSIAAEIETISVAELNQPAGLGHVNEKRVVVIGGGESAVDYANRLSKPALNNEVYLSLHSGVRVSPRYHPVRGVPSDFLRNRFMLSVDPDIRNWLGQIFVKLRIKYERQFRWLFAAKRKKQATDSTAESDASLARRKDWTMRLTMAAKDDLFNMFHNKSDDFLEAVGDQRIQIVGPPTDESFREFFPFEVDGKNEGNETGNRITIEPDFIVPAIGYQSTLEKLTGGQYSLDDFYLGCCHVDRDDLFLVGFARPIIGNIPTISEMQARYVCGLIAGAFSRPTNLKQLHQSDRQNRASRYEQLNLAATFPVEMFPYCDRLARLMKLPLGPSFFKSPLAWWRTKLAPASTMHYFESNEPAAKLRHDAPRYMPIPLVIFIALMKPVDWIYRLIKRFCKRRF